MILHFIYKYDIYDSHRSQDLVCLSDEFLDLFEHVHLHVLQLLLLSRGVSDAGAICCLGLLRLWTQTHTRLDILLLACLS